MIAIDFAERRILPDWLIRVGIRRLLANRIRLESSRAATERSVAVKAFADQLRQSPIAVHTDAANEQHYEVPAEYFFRVLGPRLKYSCGFWDNANSTLAESEDRMLALTCERAQLEDGMDVLDLGCGWGSLSLYVAEQFPACRVTGVSNSHSQREAILARAAKRGLANVEILTADVREFDPAETFDRIISIEMLEHMRNYEQLFRRISGWLNDEGNFFAHVFCHRDLAYTFETDGNNDWMARHFFTGGLMPSADLFCNFQDDLRLQQQWQVNGEHYARTCEAWLSKQDAQEAEILHLFRQGLGEGEARLQTQRWRMFYMACAELFRFQGGEEWFVSHYRFSK